jgi:glycosyltransferase involved in cell wall biosynthesis
VAPQPAVKPGVDGEAPLSVPEVSVVVPTHNRWEHLSRAALPAALGQRDVELELIVVDDGSTDETPRGLAEVRDPRLRVLRSKRAEGVARARNRGLAAARAPWVAFLDDDDLWSPLKLRAQLDALDMAAADYAYAAAVFVDGSGTPLRLDPAPEPETVASALRASDVVGGPSTVMVRTELARELGGFEPSLSVLADWDLWLRVSEVGRPVACRDVLVAYREHDDNMSAGAMRRVFAELNVVRARHALRGEVDGVRFTRWVAANQRRAGRRFAAARAYLRGAAAFRSPRLLVRGLAMPLGEGAMASPARLRALRGERPDPPPAPEWLGGYRA